LATASEHRNCLDVTVANDSARVDQEYPAFHPNQATAAIQIGDRQVGIAEQDKRQPVLFSKPAVALCVVGRDTDDLDAEIPKLLDAIAIITQLPGTYGRVVAGVESQQDPAFRRRQRKRLAAVVGQREIGGDVAGLKTHQLHYNGQMLSLTPAQRPRQNKFPSIALAIAGGGPLGAIYELGALQALDESIDGASMHDLDIYVGVSSGAFLAASLANRMTTSQMARVFMGSADAEFQFRPEQFLRPAFREYLSRATAVPGVVLDMLAEIIRHPQRITSLESVEGLSRIIPTGLFDNQSIERFLARILDKPGRTNQFGELQSKLRVVAVELESGQAVRFGEPGNTTVPISRAVQASAALPGLYPPVEIDGHYYVDGALRRTLNASAALEEGADLLIAVNPLVPYDADGHAANPATVRNRMISGGLPVVLSQTFRSLIQSRMQIGMRKYESAYPEAAIMLVEPNRNDEKMFYTNVFSYASRTELVEHAFQTTRAELRQRAGELDRFLAPFQLGLNRERLASQHSFADSLERETPHFAPVSNSLDRALDSLERLLR